MAFIIPVKSIAVTSDWAAFSRLVDRSINSICNLVKYRFQSNCLLS